MLELFSELETDLFLFLLFLFSSVFFSLLPNNLLSPFLPSYHLFPLCLLRSPWPCSRRQNSGECRTPLRPRPPGVFNSHTCVSLQQFADYRLGFLPHYLFWWQFCSDKLWISVSPVFPFWGQQFALWPQFFDEPKSGIWLLLYLFFLFWRWERQLPSSLQARPEPTNLKSILLMNEKFRVYQSLAHIVFVIILAIHISLILELCFFRFQSWYGILHFICIWFLLLLILPPPREKPNC